MPWIAWKIRNVSWIEKQNFVESKSKKLQRLSHQEFHRSFKQNGYRLPAEILKKKDANVAVGAVLWLRTHGLSQVERMLQGKKDTKPVSSPIVEVHLIHTLMLYKTGWRVQHLVLLPLGIVNMNTFQSLLEEYTGFFHLERTNSWMCCLYKTRYSLTM